MGSVTAARATIVVTPFAVGWYVPTAAEMQQPCAERQQLRASIDVLNQRGARIEISTCGPDKRLWVLVDKFAGEFGDSRTSI